MAPQRGCLKNVLGILEEDDITCGEVLQSGLENTEDIKCCFSSSTFLMDMYEKMIKKQDLVCEAYHSSSMSETDKIFEFSASLDRVKVLHNHLQNLMQHKGEIISRLHTLKNNVIRADFSSHKRVYCLLQGIPLLLNELSVHKQNINWIGDLGSKSKDLTNFPEEIDKLLASIKVPLKEVAVFREDFDNVN